MRTRTTLFLLFTAGLLVGAVVLFEKRKRDETLLPEGGELPVLMFESIDRVELSGPKGAVALARSVEGVWKLDKPASDRPDKELLESVFQALSQLASRRYLGPAELKEAAQTEAGFGLAPAERLELELFAGEEKLAGYWIGRTAPFENSVYLQREGEGNGVHIANVDLRALLDVPLARFRDHQVLRLVPEAVERLAVERDGLVTEFGWAGRDNPQWVLLKPLQTRAAVESVEAMLAQLAELDVVDFAEESAAQGADAAERDAVVRVWYAGMEEPAATLHVLPRGALGDEGRWVLCAGRQGAFEVDGASLEVLDFTTEEMRDRRLLRFPVGAATALTVRPRDLPAIRVERRGTLWLFSEPEALSGQPANGEVAEMLLRMLGEAQIERFESDSALDLAPFGLDPPLFSITLEGESLAAYGAPDDDFQTTLLLSEEYVDGPTNAAADREESTGAEPGEALAIGEVAAEGADDAFPPAPAVPDAAELAESETRAGPFYVNAHFIGEPFVFAVDAGLKASVPYLSVKWRDPVVLQFTFTTLRRMEIQSPRNLMRLTYDPVRDAWTAADGAGNDLSARVDLHRVQRLAATLATLSADSWMGDRSEALSLLADPALEIRLEREVPGEDGGPAQMVRHVLRFAPTLAGAASPRFYYGQLDSAPDVFLVETEVVRLLSESVLERGPGGN
ncbi:MAG TPA: DUF4340 domain-containing protein [Verrucomicrobiales bacterium]|nr:DUF4340 domain-containing protein [Verrucomicrobiales bacterium]